MRHLRHLFHRHRNQDSGHSQILHPHRGLHRCHHQYQQYLEYYLHQNPLES